MFYTIYKITNKLDGKYYIGKHVTTNLNDGYMGSGKFIQRAIKKHGLNNFTKEILHIFDNEAAMNAKERELVIVSEETYNLCEGGKGGWSYINRCGLNKKFTEQERKKGSRTISKKWKSDPLWAKKQKEKIYDSNSKLKEAAKTAFLGKNHSQEWKNSHSSIMKEKQQGIKNSQYGTCWITNGIENKKIPKTELDKWTNSGYNRGRVCVIRLEARTLPSQGNDMGSNPI